MSNLLEKSLDDIIKSNRKPSRADNHSRGGGRGFGGSGPVRRFTSRGGSRPAPYSRTVQAPEAAWQHDMFTNDAMGFTAVAGGGSGLETGAKLYLSNLDFGVSNEDIKELFSEVGDLKRYGIHYDRSGRSKGTAEVVYSRRNDAMAAVKRYNNVQLDGKPMKIEIVGANLSIPSAPLMAANVMYGNAYDGPLRSRGRGGLRGRPRGGFGDGAVGGRGGRGSRGGRGGSRGRGRGRDEKISPEDLDADLEKYHKEAMETN